MADSLLPPYMRKLISLLARPNCLRIATNMIKSWMDRNTSQLKDGSEINCEEDCSVQCCTHCCLIATNKLVKASDLLICVDFHWKCVLHYLSLNHLCIDQDNFDLRYCFNS